MKKIAAIILLLIATIFSLSFLSAQVTIEGYGRGVTTVNPDGTWYFECDNSSNTNCSLTIKPPKG